jgi:hypothetical protein
MRPTMHLRPLAAHKESRQRLGVWPSSADSLELHSLALVATSGANPAAHEAGDGLASLQTPSAFIRVIHRRTSGAAN